MNRKSLFLARQFQLSTRRRFMFPKEGEQGGTTGGNNGGAAGGNAGESGNTGQESNNTGDQFDAEAFWRGPAPAGGTGASGESATGGTGQQQESGTGGDLNTQLTQQLSSMTFGDPIFTAEIAEQVNGGDFSGVQKNMEAAMQQAVRQSLAMNVQILRPFAEQMMNQMREEFGSTLTNRDNQDTLTKDFPAAKDPRVAPAIKQIFDQALKNTGGDRTKAVAQTKSMMALMANVTGGDVGLTVAPQGSEDSRPAQPVVNWLDEITGR